MLDRIIGALTFRAGIYQEVEHDKTFTPQAWLIVIVVGFLSQFGALNTGEIGLVLVSAAAHTVGIVLAFAVGAWVIAWTGRVFFNAPVDFGEMVRTMGLAYIWNIMGFLGVLVLLSPALTIIAGPAIVIGLFIGLIAWFVAVREALDLGPVPTLGVLILGVLVYFFLLIVFSFILGTLGLAGAGIVALFM